jgi:hypothetical protein
MIVKYDEVARLTKAFHKFDLTNFQFFFKPLDWTGEILCLNELFVISF